MSDAYSTSIESGAMRAISSHAALAALCPLIPVPFLDDFIIARIHRRMSAEVGQAYGVRVSSRAAKILEQSPSGFFKGIFAKLALYPITKLIKKIIYVLAIKSMADVGAAIFYDGWLLARAIELGLIEPEELARPDTERVRALRRAILASQEAVDTAPLKLAFRTALKSSSSIARRAASVIGKRAADPDRDEARPGAEIDPVARRIEDEIDPAHLERLDQALREAAAREITGAARAA